MVGLIVEILFMLFSIITPCNGLKMIEYEAYWLTGFPRWALTNNKFLNMLLSCSECLIIKACTYASIKRVGVLLNHDVILRFVSLPALQTIPSKK